jgi:hypothetical protein
MERGMGHRRSGMQERTSEFWMRAMAYVRRREEGRGEVFLVRARECSLVYIHPEERLRRGSGRRGKREQEEWKRKEKKDDTGQGRSGMQEGPR